MLADGLFMSNNPGWDDLGIKQKGVQMCFSSCQRLRDSVLSVWCSIERNLQLLIVLTSIVGNCALLVAVRECW